MTETTHKAGEAVPALYEPIDSKSELLRLIAELPGTNSAHAYDLMARLGASNPALWPDTRATMSELGI